MQRDAARVCNEVPILVPYRQVMIKLKAQRVCWPDTYVPCTYFQKPFCWPSLKERVSSSGE